MYRTAAILLGIGFGGLCDSIVLHQLLQLHMMLSSVLPPTTVAAVLTNVRWGGVVDAMCYVCAGAGAIATYRAARLRMPVPAPRVFAGGILMGWGGFNVVEGLVDQEILRLHHMIEGPSPLLGDLLYLALGGAALLWIGALLTTPRRDWASTKPRKKRFTAR